MPTAPSEDCARSGPDPEGESTPAGSRPTDTPPPPDFVSLFPHATRTITRSTSTLDPKDLATVENRLASIPSTSLGRVPPRSNFPLRRACLRPNLLPVHLQPPIGSRGSACQHFSTLRLLAFACQHAAGLRRTACQRTDSAMRIACSFRTSASRRSATPPCSQSRTWPGRRYPADPQYPGSPSTLTRSSSDPTVLFPPRYADSTSPGISVRTRLILVSPSGGSPPL